MDVKPRRRSLIYLRTGSLCLALLLMTGIQGSFTAQAEGKAAGARTKVVKKGTLPRLGSHESLRIKAVPEQADGSATQGIADDQDFPPSTCTQYAEFTTNSYYTNGILDLTTTDYFGDVECVPNDPFNPHETMAYLSVFTELGINSDIVQQAPEDTCLHQNLNDDACTVVFSTNSHLCVGQAQCAGIYQVLLNTVLTVPRGYIFTSWPEGCTLVVPSEVACTFGTEVVVIDPTD